MYAKIIKEPRTYNTIVAFGDNDSPSKYGAGTELKSEWIIENIYSLHTDKNSSNVVGYAKYLKPKNSPILIKNWVQTLN